MTEQKTKTLLDLKLGEKALISAIDGCDDIQRRLYGFGIIEGVEIMLVKDTPFNSPKIYKFLNTHVALRRGIAKKIMVRSL